VLDFVLRLGRRMMLQIDATIGTMMSKRATTYDMYQKDDSEMLQRVQKLCEDPLRSLILAARNAELIAAELVAARQGRETVVAIISDLSPDARDAWNRQLGGGPDCCVPDRPRPWRSPTVVWLVVGDHAYRCHEDREIGIRSALRTSLPKVVLGGEAQGEDNPSKTHEAVACFRTPRIRTGFCMAPCRGGTRRRSTGSGYNGCRRRSADTPTKSVWNPARTITRSAGGVRRGAGGRGRRPWPDEADPQGLGEGAAVMEGDDNIVVLPTRATAQPPQEDRVVAAALKLKGQPMRQVNWPAVITFLVISIGGLTGAAVVPSTADAGVRWSAVMALMIGFMSGGLAVLYRHAPSFWVVRRPKARRAKARQ
jgi:hypothetical protein